MDLREAQLTARAVIKHLAPHCDRIEVAGIVRRGKLTNVKDVEIVCIPKSIHTQGLFGPQDMRVDLGFIASVNQWDKVKGEPTGKYTQRILPNGVTLDLFIATPENCVLQMIIRTGSRNFGPGILRKFNARGFKCEGGHPIHLDTGEVLNFAEEEEVFKYLGMDYVEPERRV